MFHCFWPLGLRETLEFDVYPTSTQWKDLAGLYIFARPEGNSWKALYVGQTENFKERFASHERLDEAILRGATHIHAKHVPQMALRNEWEERLIRHTQPPMNIQHR